MAREGVSEARLLAILNEKLAGGDRCDDCTFLGPLHRLEEPDEEGCNWHQLPILICEGRSTYHCAHWALKVVQDASKQFNLL